MTPVEKIWLLAEANGRLIAAGREACRDASELAAEGKTEDEVIAAIKRYAYEQLEPWRVRAYREIRRLIEEASAATIGRNRGGKCRIVCRWPLPPRGNLRFPRVAVSPSSPIGPLRIPALSSMFIRSPAIHRTPMTTSRLRPVTIRRSALLTVASAGCVIAAASAVEPSTGAMSFTGVTLDAEGQSSGTLANMRNGCGKISGVGPTSTYNVQATSTAGFEVVAAISFH